MQWYDQLSALKYGPHFGLPEKKGARAKVVASAGVSISANRQVEYPSAKSFSKSI